MTFDEYIVLARKTAPTHLSKEMQVLHCDLGVMSEIGEVADLFKKLYAYDDNADFKNKLKEEVGDVFWYLFNLSDLFNDNVQNNDYYYNKFVSYIKGTDVKLTDFLSKYICNFDTHSNIIKISILIYLLRLYDITVSETLEFNINKLKQRFPSKF